MNNYEYSRFLQLIFYKNCGKFDKWQSYSNGYITNINDLIENFIKYKEDTNKQMISLFQKTSLSGEFEKINMLKSEWLEFVKRFSKLENEFEEKYKGLIQKKEKFFESNEELKVFLAEYSAYEKMASAYEALLNLDSQIENYRKMCLFYKCQLQPS